MAADLSFNKLWSDAEARFETRTRKRLRGSPPESLEAVIEKLKSRIDGEDVENKVEKKKRILTVVQNVMTCIKLLGGIAAASVSTVSPRIPSV